MKMVKIGFDLDGVLARHYLDRFWFMMRKRKEKELLAKDGRGYIYPETWLEKLFLTAINRLRRISSLDREEIKALANREGLEIYLVTGRFGFLQDLTLSWLKRNNLIRYFSYVFLNKDNQDPTYFKASVINRQGLDIFIDDDLEVLERLSSKTGARLFWLVPDWRKTEENGHYGIVSINSLGEIFSKTFTAGLGRKQAL
jgi:hypothetical protein